LRCAEQLAGNVPSINGTEPNVPKVPATLANLHALQGPLGCAIEPHYTRGLGRRMKNMGRATAQPGQVLRLRKARRVKRRYTDVRRCADHGGPNWLVVRATRAVVRHLHDHGFPGGKPRVCHNRSPTNVIRGPNFQIGAEERSDRPEFEV